MRTVADYMIAFACIAIGLGLAMLAMVLIAVVANWLTGDIILGAAMACTFGAATATPILNNVARYSERFRGVAQEVPLTDGERNDAVKELRFYLFKSTCLVIMFTVMAVPIAEDPVLTAVFAALFGAIGLFLGYQSLRWTTLIKLSRPAPKENTAT